MAYIRRLERLIKASEGMPEPPSSERFRAVLVLANSPVEGYASFVAREVRLIGRYRYQFSATDSVWRAMVDGHPEAWIFAVHEAAELDAFSQSNVNSFDPEQIARQFQVAHEAAVERELDFLQAWASQVGLEVSRVAIEWTNPLRGQFPWTHRKTIADLMRRNSMAEPTDHELAVAARLWDLVLSRSLDR